MDCYYHGYSGSGGRCIGCEIDEANGKDTVDFPARDAEGRVIRDKYKPKKSE